MDDNLKTEEKEGLENIMDLWKTMQNKNDLLLLLNKSLIQLYGNDAKPISILQLNYHTYSSNNKKRYYSFQIPKKKKGEFRTIDAPCEGLKTIQQCLNVIFQSVYTPHLAAVGFVPNRSVIDGARIHLKQKFVYNIDLKDFFPSVTAGRLFKRLQSKPFCLNKDLASIITDLCCYTNAEGHNVLPQGAPTSPSITNFICERLDRKLSKLATAYGLKYSRYADDITFSGIANVFSEGSNFHKSLIHIIEEEEHFKVNTDKTRLLHRGMRQEVTGVTINEKPNVSRKYVKQIRSLIHSWEANGYEEAQKKFLKHYMPTKNVAGIHHIENIINGKLDYLKMVKGDTNLTYKKLKQRYETLMIRYFHKKESAICENENTPEIEKNWEFSIKDENDILNELIELDKLLE